MNRGLLFSLVVVAVCASGAVGAADDRWFMVVKTVSTDPAKEAEFNDWYDRIDIPDVLEVPGYMRARRGLGQPLPEFPAADLQEGEGKYVALYDIRSPNIDRTIIDMLMLSQKMTARGRSTNLLKVVGRFYYQQTAPAYEAPEPKSAGPNRYLVLITADCCADAAQAGRFAKWYERSYVPAVLRAPGVLRLTRYRLYRVLMVDPVDMPPFLAVAEVAADSAGQAARSLERVAGRIAAEGSANGLYTERGSTVYLQIADVPRP